MLQLMRSMKNTSFLICLAAFFCLRVAAAPVEAGVYAISNARVYTISGDVIEAGTVIIQDGRITAVGKHVTVPGNARVINGHGLEVYPGMIDAGSHLGLTEIGAVAATNDSTELGELNPQLLAASAFHPASEHIPVTRVNGITSSLSTPEGGTLSGQAVLVHLAGWTIDEMAIRKSAGMVLNFPIPGAGRGSGAGGGRGTFLEARRNYEKKVDELSRMLREARHYWQAKQAAGLPRVESDLKMEALVPVIKGELPVLMHAVREREIRNALEFSRRENLKIILTGAGEAWRVADLLKQARIPVILGQIISMPLREDDPYDAPFTLPAVLHKAGVKFCFSSEDSAYSRNLPYHAGVAVAYGLPRDAALRALTLGAAEILGVADQVGSLEAGKIADVVVTDGDLLEPKTQIKYLFINGKPVDLRTRQTELADKYMARP